jgi:DNA repair exonuclease SbcCD ATPase subunit
LTPAVILNRKEVPEVSMGKVYESLKEVVKLQRSKNDSVASPGTKPTDASSLDVEIGELVQRITGLRAAVSHREEEIKKETQQVIQTLSEDFAILETKLRDAEETARRKESVSQKMEERLYAEIHTLQNELNREKQTLQSRDNDIKDLKSNMEIFAKQATESERAIKQAKADAMLEASRTEQLTESLNRKIAALDANISDMKEIIRSKEATINALEQELGTAIRDFENQLRNKEELLAGRDAEINDLKSKLQVLTGKIQGMASFLKQAEALAIVEGQNGSMLATSEPLDGVKKKPPESRFKVKVPAATSNEQTNVAQKTVSPDFFDLMNQELTVIMGHQASVIVRERVAALGESMQEFPKSRLAELLEILSKDVVDEPSRIGFRKWFVKQHV